MSNPAIPPYGKVIWRDATSYSAKTKAKQPTKELPVVISIGRLFLGSDGTLVILHEYQDAPGEYQRQVEATFIPVGWYTQIIPLTEPNDTPKKVEGSDAVHQAA